MKKIVSMNIKIGDVAQVCILKMSDILYLKWHGRFFGILKEIA